MHSTWKNTVWVLALVTQLLSYSHQLGDASHLFTYLFVFFFCFALSSVLLYTNTLTNPTTCFGLFNCSCSLHQPLLLKYSSCSELGDNAETFEFWSPFSMVILE